MYGVKDSLWLHMLFFKYLKNCLRYRILTLNVLSGHNNYYNLHKTLSKVLYLESRKMSGQEPCKGSYIYTTVFKNAWITEINFRLFESSGWSKNWPKPEKTTNKGWSSMILQWRGSFNSILPFSLKPLIIVEWVIVQNKKNSISSDMCTVLIKWFINFKELPSRLVHHLA